MLCTKTYSLKALQQVNDFETGLKPGRDFDGVTFFAASIIDLGVSVSADKDDAFI